MSFKKKERFVSKGGFGDSEDSAEFVQRRAKLNEEIDLRFGYEKHETSTERIGWLINFHPADVLDENKRSVSAVDYYFAQEDGGRFKVSLPYKPYFFVAARVGLETEVSAYLVKKYSGTVSSVEHVLKEDLDLANHLSGIKRTYLKLSFLSVTDLMKVKRDLMPKIKKNREKEKTKCDYTEMLANHLANGDTSDFSRQIVDQTDNIIDIREYDVPYHVRVSIDLKIFVGHWYSVIGRGSLPPEIHRRSDLIDWPDPIVLAFDIETTKLPLKFPDPLTDQVMMISYMIDAQGYLIVNREIVAADVEDFEYTPKPEYEGPFTIFNEENEFACLRRFFEHIQDVKPHVIVTYNGDAFDWPFVEARANQHGLDIFRETGFQKDAQEEYKARHIIHMDAFRWVKRDSYLPVGSQNLKACTRAKLRYDPVELDPEEMCRMAAEQPQVLANYSVSDAVATYYLYMKYVHPFVFALCTIIPMEPDEVLRKGSGTLCEALLMVEAYHANIIFPNKQETVLNKLTEDGHMLDEETYVGGHVEAIESGVFRADIPSRFRMVPDAFQQLMDGVERALTHAIEDEEKIPLAEVVNFEEVCTEIKSKLAALRDCPSRLENPIIYHLDVGAMYPNIILTNRLQPPAIVDDATCAACDFNLPGARCQRVMPWMWRGELIPATRNEYHRTVQQLETERFPPSVPNGPHRAFHELAREEQASIEKKRLQEYCRKAYKRVRETRTELRQTTICQRENSFYVDTVRAFRDRRYEFKDMLKAAKKKLAAAMSSGDAGEIKSCKAKEVIYDSLQLAHKCILNSFYGYVMRRGSRWHSMEMAGIVCYTGAQIITQARELVEQIGRPLELDTDGIWCMLPASFPENFTITTTNPKKPKFNISYPGCMLNMMVKDTYTNDQYHELIDAATRRYETRSENSIFFEVDGPYLAMVLPAAKEEGKKLKKRYAVFNFDGSLAELKGFEVKRRGELELIKIFQSSVFESFLKGKTLGEVYESVAKVADYWLDVLYSQACEMPDSELFDLISENKNLSRKLEDYGAQKSTTISTAKRLREFLGDQVVKDGALNCRFVIARRPEGAPVTERAIPLAIFQSEPSVKIHYLNKWKATNSQDYDIRSIIDWNYYIERLSSAIQKIITIPAALQGISNPVPRVTHPDWLHKRLVEKTDVLKQRRINEVFKPVEKVTTDMEDIASTPSTRASLPARAARTPASERRRALVADERVAEQATNVEQVQKSWREEFGSSPLMGNTKQSMLAWLTFQKKRWSYTLKQRSELHRKLLRIEQQRQRDGHSGSLTLPRIAQPDMLHYARQSAQALLDLPWQILQLHESSTPGLFIAWVLVGGELRDVKLNVPRMFYINQKVPKQDDNGLSYRRVHRILPRANEVKFLYEYRVEEGQFQQHVNDLYAELSVPEVEGVYETQTPLDFRVLTQLGCVCQVAKEFRSRLATKVNDTFDLESLEFRSLSHGSSTYLESGEIRYVYLYHYTQDTRSMLALFIPANARAIVFAVDRAKSNQMPNLSSLFNAERNMRIRAGADVDTLPQADHQFDVTVESSLHQAYRGIQRALQAYKDLKRGPTVVALQTSQNLETMLAAMPYLHGFPVVTLHVSERDNLYTVLDWQRVGSRQMIRHYLRVDSYLMSYLELCRYMCIPLGNVPRDVAVFGADVFFARYLQRANHVLWCSPTERPDLGGKEVDENRLVVEFDESKDIDINEPGLYASFCVEIDVASLPVAALLQAHHIGDHEGTTASIGFDAAPQLSISELVGGESGYKMLAGYDESALCASAFRILKAMVHSWVREVQQNQNIYADNQLIHFYRWLSSPQALLHEPALKKMLHAVMKKLFLLLIAELKRLGAVVVHASVGRLIVCTKKRSRDDAMAYVEFVLKSLQTRDIFSALHLSVQRGWELLVWLDAANYGGVRADASSANRSMSTVTRMSLAATETAPTEDSEDIRVVDGEESQGGAGEPQIEMHWSMMHFLPKAAACQKNFELIIAGYISYVYDRVRQDDGLNASMQQEQAKKTRKEKPSAVCGKDDEDDDDEDDGVPLTTVVQACRELIRGELSQRMFSIVQKVHRKLALVTSERGDGAQEVFPVFPGSYLRMTNPALELVKCVCKVLSLDSGVLQQVEKLRRDLLKLIGVGQFAEVAEFRDPCLSYVVREMICKRCNYCRNLDLCRDAEVLAQSSVDDGQQAGDNNGGVIAPLWSCSHCGTVYDVGEIERHLIRAVNRLLMSCVLQDVKCTKCKEIKQTHMQRRCECSAAFQLCVTTRETTDRLRIFYNIARFYKMPLLAECLDWLLANAPTMRKQLDL